jgi:hypothetical protein
VDDLYHKIIINKFSKYTILINGAFLMKKYSNKLFRALQYIEALLFDGSRIDKEIHSPKFFNHKNGVDWIIDNFDKAGMQIL